MSETLAKSDSALANSEPATVRAITKNLLVLLYASTLLSSANLYKLKESPTSSINLSNNEITL